MKRRPSTQANGGMIRLVLGEIIAKLLDWGVPPKNCRVVMTDPQGTKRSVSVTAESLFEAAALAVYAFKKDGFTDFISNVLDVEIREPTVRHQVSIGQLKQWLNGTVQDPRERTRRDRLKSMIG